MATRTELSAEHSSPRIVVARGCRAGFGGATVRVDSALVKHTGLLSLEARGVAVSET